MEPLASVAQLRLNMKPERDYFTIPKIVADVVFEEIVIALGKNQVCDFWPLWVYAAPYDICLLFKQLNIEQTILCNH